MESSDSHLQPIDEFINRLAEIDPIPSCFNPYHSGNESDDQIRRNNLRLYLTTMKKYNPTVLVVGEAPGYRGCHWTGIPISSEKLVLDKSHLLYSHIEGLSVVNEVAMNKRKPYSENTATIMWKFINLYSSDTPPLFWNSFPLHTYKGDNQLSNRAPKDSEISKLSWSLTNMLQMFPSITEIVALGRKAEKVLESIEDLGLNFTYVRHPSQGGYTECEKGLRKIFHKRKSEGKSPRATKRRKTESAEL
jgi:uracil-DNA glycosylase